MLGRHDFEVEDLVNLGLRFEDLTSAMKNKDITRYNLFGLSPLYEAVINGEFNSALAFLKKDQLKSVDLKELDKQYFGRKTLLHLMVVKGMKYVSRKEIEPKFQQPKYQEIRHLVHEFLKIAKRNEKLNEVINLKDMYGLTPLDLACIKKDDEMIYLLVRYGAKRSEHHLQLYKKNIPGLQPQNIVQRYVNNCQALMAPFGKGDNRETQDLLSTCPSLG